MFGFTSSVLVSEADCSTEYPDQTAQDPRKIPEERQVSRADHREVGFKGAGHCLGDVRFPKKRLGSQLVSKC